MNALRLLHISLASLSLVGVARAQFTGDIFFETPSVAVPADETATLTITAFTGTAAFGAAHFELIFDPDELRIDALAPGDEDGLGDALISAAGPGRRSVVVMNARSVVKPFGLVTLADVTVRPLAPPGSTVTLAIVARAMIDAQRDPFPAPAGFAAQIVVTSPQGTAAGHAGSSDRRAALALAPDPDVLTAPPTWLEQRALLLRRPGQTVPIVLGEWRGARFVPRTVLVKTRVHDARSE